MHPDILYMKKSEKRGTIWLMKTTIPKVTTHQTVNFQSLMITGRKGVP